MSDIKDYKCPTCGAPMKYNIDTQKMVCTFCSNVYDFDYVRNNFNEPTSEKSDDFDWIKQTQKIYEPEKVQNLSEYTCPSCGGSIITWTVDAVTKCPFCEHDLIISDKFKSNIRPDKIIPFRKSLKDFNDEYWRQVDRFPYIPETFRNKTLINKTVGRYVPMWLYSCSCQAIDKDNCTLEMRIEDYPIPGTKTDKVVFYSVEPFNYDEAEDFTESYLAGFCASRYTIGAEKAVNIANAEIKEFCAKETSHSVKASYSSNLPKLNCTISDPKLTYYLVPIWTKDVWYKDKNYTFAMNGQTGEFYGSEIFKSFKPKSDEKKNTSCGFYLIFLIIILLIFIYSLLNNKFLLSITAVVIFTISFYTAIVRNLLKYLNNEPNSLKYGDPTRAINSDMRTIKDFVRDKKKTLIEPTADNKNETPNE